jgi:hypothetical protein
VTLGRIDRSGSEAFWTVLRTNFERNQVAEKLIQLIGEQNALDLIESIELHERSSPPPDPSPPPEPPPPDPVGEPLPEINADGRILLTRADMQYGLTEDLTVPVWYLDKGITLHLNGHSIRTEKSAVRAYTGWKDKVYGENTPVPTDFTLQGPGTIESLKESAFFSGSGSNVQIRGVELICHAADTGCVRTSSSVTVEDCLCVSNVTQTLNRHQLPAVISSQWSPSTVRDTVILGGQVGISAVSSRTTVQRCFISPNSVATNGYAIAIYREDKSLIEDCVIFAQNGRGILINGGLDNALADAGNVVRRNLIFAREIPNAEFGAALNACCVRLRYNARNNLVEGNCCLAIGGAESAGASALYLSNAKGVSNRYAGNVFAAILVGPGLANGGHVDHYGKAITLEGQGAWIDGEPQFNDDVIEANEINTNHIGLSCSGRDGWQIGAHLSAPLTGNSFRRKNGDAILAEFATAARGKLQALTISSENRQRCSLVMEKIIASYESADLGIKQNSFDVWTNKLWRTPVTVTVQGSGPEKGSDSPEGLVVRRDAFSADWPVRITIEP